MIEIGESGDRLAIGNVPEKRRRQRGEFFRPGKGWRAILAMAVPWESPDAKGGATFPWPINPGDAA
jgi:hypothetical protein